MSDPALAGRLAIVTGSLGRLGPVWTQALASEGASVVGVDVNEEGAEELERAVAELDGAYRHRRADVTRRDELEALSRELDVAGDVPSVLVCNAGIDQPPSAAAGTRLVQDIPSEEFRATVDVNLVGTFHAIQAFGSGMAAAGQGSIVNIGSVYASIAPDPGLYDHLPVDPPFLKPPAYAASKAGVASLTRYFARLWGPRGVRVNTLSPGGVRAGQDPEFLRKYSERVPLGRMAETDDLVGPLVFLASEASAYLTGHELRVDGGFTA